MTKKDEYSQNHYNVINESKYVGKGKPFYRSSYEHRMMTYLDKNENVLEWCSECVCIPYFFEVDQKWHRYYTDFKAKIKTSDGVKTYIIEVKPIKQTKPPSKPKNRGKKRAERYRNEMFMYIRNKNKWEAAEQYCKKYGYVFKIITETEIFNGQR